MKTEEQVQARELRARGWSVKQIERHLNVSRSSVSRWVRGVRLSEGQRDALANRVTVGRLASNERIAQRARDVRRSYQDIGRRLARERDSSYAVGCMLYWAEGAKARNSVELVNSDPDLLRFFADFLRSHFAVPSDKIRISCNLFADHLARQREVEEFWLSTLGLPSSSLRKSQVNMYSKYSQKKRMNKLPHGTCKLVVHSTEIVQTIYGSIQELATFRRDEWLH